MNFILRLERKDGSEANTEEDIEELATSYFNNLFKFSGVGDR